MKGIVKGKHRAGLPEIDPFPVAISLGPFKGGDLIPVEALVDTSRLYSVLPESLLTQMGVEPLEIRKFSLADGSVGEYGFGMVRIQLDGQECYSPVAFGPDGEYRLGRLTLDIFHLSIDPAQIKLVPYMPHVRPF